MKSIELKVTIYEPFIETIIDDVKRVIALKKEEITEESIQSFLEFLLGFGCHHHIEDTLKFYLSQMELKYIKSKTNEKK
ncbi:MAG: hypothetical protein QM689_08730 [Oscillospiraceae bacterium]